MEKRHLALESLVEWTCVGLDMTSKGIRCAGSTVQWESHRLCRGPLVRSQGAAVAETQ